MGTKEGKKGLKNPRKTEEKNSENEPAAETVTTVAAQTTARSGISCIAF